MSAVAKLMAVMGLDARDFERGMGQVNRTTDGAKRKVQDFNTHIGGIHRLMKVAFAAQFVSSMSNALKSVENFKKETGIGLIPDSEIEKLKRAETLIQGIGAALKGAALQAVAFFIPGGKPDTKGSAEDRAGLGATNKKIEEMREAAKTNKELLADGEKELRQKEIIAKKAETTARSVYELQRKQQEAELQRMVVAELREKVESENAREREKRDQETGNRAKRQADENQDAIKEANRALDDQREKKKRNADAEYDALKDAQKAREDKERQAEQDYKTIQRAGEQAKANTPLFARAPDALARVGGSLGPNPMAAMRREDAHARQQAMIQAIAKVEMAIAGGGGGE